MQELRTHEGAPQCNDRRMSAWAKDSRGVFVVLAQPDIYTDSRKEGAMTASGMTETNDQVNYVKKELARLSKEISALAYLPRGRAQGLWTENEIESKFKPIHKDLACRLADLGARLEV